MIQHQARAENGGQRVDHALARDIGRGAVHGFEHGGEPAQRIEIGAGGEAHAADVHCALAARPMLPTMMAERSLRMSAKRFEPTTTSKLCGRRIKFMAAASTSSDSVSISGYWMATCSKVRSHSTMLSPCALDLVMDATRRFLLRLRASSKAKRTIRSTPRRVKTEAWVEIAAQSKF